MSTCIPIIRLVLALSLLFVAVGCSSTRIGRKEIESEFNAAVGPASEDFVDAVARASGQFQRDISTGFDEIEAEFAALCLDSDGYLARTEGADATEVKLRDYMRVAVTDLLNQSLETFSDRYSDAKALLERRLLVNLPPDPWFEPAIKKHEKGLSRYSPGVSADDLRGSATVKAIDDAVGWVPVAGDVYDVAKLLIYDPREEAIKERAAEYVRDQERHWGPMIRSLMSSVPPAETVERICRDHFSAKRALQQLETE